MFDLSNLWRLSPATTGGRQVKPCAAPHDSGVFLLNDKGKASLKLTKVLPEAFFPLKLFMVAEVGSFSHEKVAFSIEVVYRIRGWFVFTVAVVFTFQMLSLK